MPAKRRRASSYSSGPKRARSVRKPARRGRTPRRSTRSTRAKTTYRGRKRGTPRSRTGIERTFRSIPAVLTRRAQQDMATLSGALRPYNRVRQNYYEQVNVGDGSTVAPFQTWIANNTFDPNSTGTGHQPYGRDAMAAMYQFYCVLGCFVDILFENLTNEHYVGFLRCGTWTDTLTQQILMEQTNADSKTCIIRAANENVESEWRRLKMYVSIPKHQRGQTTTSLSSSETFITRNGAAIGAGPAFSVPIQVGICNVDGATAPAANSVRIRCRLTYDVVYFTPIVTGLAS